MILFDGECPMCNIYTRVFVKTGMLDAQYGRGEYQKEMTACPLIDKQRAVNEIALVNLESGEVTYGVNSVFKVIGNAFPFFKPLFALRPFAWLMSKIYAFISYNRRVIIPANEAGNSFAWQPTFKLHYRIAYLLFTWFCTGFMLTAYTKLLAPVIPAGGVFREYIICGGQVFFQGAVISLFARGRIWEYLGNMMTISFAGGLLLMLPLLVNHCLHTSTEKPSPISPVSSSCGRSSACL